MAWKRSTDKVAQLVSYGAHLEHKDIFSVFKVSHTMLLLLLNFGGLARHALAPTPHPPSTPPHTPSARAPPLCAGCAPGDPYQSTTKAANGTCFVLKQQQAPSTPPGPHEGLEQGAPSASDDLQEGRAAVARSCFLRPRASTALCALNDPVENSSEEHRYRCTSFRSAPWCVIQCVIHAHPPRRWSLRAPAVAGNQ